jgi:beta-galactosidase
MYLSTECGINRVFIRSTSQPGKITLIAKRTGLEPATVNIESRKLRITDGLATKTP